MSKGLVHIYTGDGKGKTTAALGLALRAAGQGFKVIIIQFLKGDDDCGEHIFASRYHPFEIVQLTRGNCFIMPEDELREDVEKTMSIALEAINNRDYQMVILDEVFVAINRGLLEIDRVIELIVNKPDSLELVLTGRGAIQEIREMADYVTEMQMIKHPYTKGTRARKGIEH